MESQHFDRFTRLWATSSRRRVLAGLAATALMALRPHQAGAACNPGSCNAAFDCGLRTCVGLTCQPTFFDNTVECRPAVGECDVAEFCTGASLACPADQKRPNGAACSSDGNPCTDDICQNGQCVHPAKPEGAACDDDGNACTDDFCFDGLCLHTVTSEGTPCDNDGTCCGVLCFKTQTDASHCGSCDRVCGAGQLCCDGACIAPQTNKSHCGQCGKPCKKGRCRNGRCKRRRKKR